MMSPAHTRRSPPTVVLVWRSLPMFWTKAGYRLDNRYL
jgi:hypothetical protein